MSAFWYHRCGYYHPIITVMTKVWGITKIVGEKLSMSFDIYPAPKKINISSAWLNLTGRYLIVLPKMLSNRFQQSLSQLTDIFPDPQTAITFGKPAAKSILLQVRPPVKSVGAESYQLKVSEKGIELRAGDEQGLYYGFLTLGQILKQSPSRIPHLAIEDSPDFSARGVMLDISRCKVPKLDTLFNLIERLSRLKYNQLQLYTEHTFAFTNHPLVWKDASPYTADDIIRIRTFCENHFVELVPNLNSFGHMERWLRHPEYHRYAECPEGFTHPLSKQTMEFGSTLKPDKNSVTLLKSLYDEYLPLFTSDHFNVGFDEPWELGRGWSENQCTKRGKTRVYLDFLAEVQKLVQSNNRSMQFWGDILLTEPQSLKSVSKSTTALNWGYEAKHPFNTECRSLAEAGLPFYVVPGTSSWKSITGRSSNLAGNLENAAKNGIKYGAQGYLVTDWGDGGHHQYQGISYPGYLLGACHAWNHKSVRSTDTLKGLNSLFFDDEEGTTATVFHELGKVLELAPANIENATIFHHLLFWDKLFWDRHHPPSALNSISEKQLQDCLNRFDEIRSQINGIGCRSPDREIIQRELGNAISMAELGINRHLARQNRSRTKTGTGSVRKETLSTSNLRLQLMEIIKNHEELWLARNRPGGLRESVSHLSSINNN